MHLFLLFITIALMLGYCILIWYYRAGWQKLEEANIKAVQSPKTSISILVAARNESAFIGDCLRSLQAQDYPPHLFEIIIIDDHSTDDTAAIVARMENANTRLIRLAEYTKGETLNSYKKKAIEIGISQARGTLIVTTDADCTVTKNWLREMASCYETFQPVFIAAPVSINCRFNLLEMFQAVDFMSLQGITAAGIRNRMHGMCNGANLAYERAAFYKVNGFEGINDIASGDDMMLMHKIEKAFPGRTRFLKSREAIVETNPVSSVGDFLRQRIRWASKADRYEEKKLTAILLLVYLVNVFMFLIPILAFTVFRESEFRVAEISFNLIQAWALLLAIKIMVELIFLVPVASFFHKRPLLWLFPIMQPFHIIYTVVAGWLGKFGKYQWKGRTVK